MLRQPNGEVVTNIFMLKMGGVVAESELRLATDQALWVRSLVEVCVVFWRRGVERQKFRSDKHINNNGYQPHHPFTLHTIQ